MLILGLYNENKDLIDSYKQLPGEWLLLDTQKYHSVGGYKKQKELHCLYNFLSQIKMQT